jgi:hypothetical protein
MRGEYSSCRQTHDETSLRKLHPNISSIADWHANTAALLGRILILQLLTSNEKQVEEQTKVHDRPEPARIQEWKGFKGVEGKGIKNSLRAGYNALEKTHTRKKSPFFTKVGL